MNVVTAIIRLRWALTVATLHRSVWQIVVFALSCMLGFATVLGVGALAWSVGMPSFASAVDGGNASFTTVMQPVTAIAGTMLLFCVALAQILIIGEGTTLSPRGFALYGIGDHTLQTGLFIATMTGIPAITGILSATVWSLAYRRAGAAAMFAQVVGGVLTIVVIVSITRMLVSLVGTLVRSRRGGNALYVVVMLVIVVVAQLPAIFGGSLQSGSIRLAALESTGRWLVWTPFAAATQLPFDVMAGRWVAFFTHIVIVALTVLFCYGVCIWCMRRDRLAAPPASTVNEAKGIGPFGWMPDSVSGAVSARVLINLRHDPRQAMMFVFPLLFAIVFALQSGIRSDMVWQALIWGGFCMSIAESNGLAYDGRGFIMQAQMGVRGRDDRCGRVRVFAGIAVAYLVVLAMGILLVTGSWHDADGWFVFLAYLGAGLGIALTSLGVAEIFSNVLLYPVAPIDHPFSSPQGRAMGQVFIPLVYMVVTSVALSPTIVAAFMSGVVDYPLWVVGAIGLVNGMLILSCGVWIGGRLMDRRLPSIVTTLDSFASLQR